MKNYNYKYLKYKNKYLNLLNGGAHDTGDYSDVNIIIYAIDGSEIIRFNYNKWEATFRTIHSVLIHIYNTCQVKLTHLVYKTDAYTADSSILLLNNIIKDDSPANKDIVIHGVLNNEYLQKINDKFIPILPFVQRKQGALFRTFAYNLDPEEKSDILLELQTTATDHDWIFQIFDTPMILEFAPETLRNDKDIVLAAGRLDERALQYASDNLKNDVDVLFAIISSDLTYIMTLSDEIKKNLLNYIFGGNSEKKITSIINHKNFLQDVLDFLKLIQRFQDDIKDKPKISQFISKCLTELYNVNNGLTDDNKTKIIQFIMIRLGNFLPPPPETLVRHK